MSQAKALKKRRWGFERFRKSQKGYRTKYFHLSLACRERDKKKPFPDHAYPVPAFLSQTLPVSHHPPISAYFYVSPENDLMIYGELKPKSKFLGNSAANQMGGENRVVLLDRLEDGEYAISMPNM